jgi:hypothetical protein
MNEATSIFMTMIESTLNKMIDARIEAKMAELNARLKVVEALEEQLTSAITLLDTAFNAKQPATTATLDLQSEEFRLSVIKIIDQQVMEDTFLDPLIDALIDCDTFNDKVKEISAGQVGSSIEDAMSDHCCDYEHEDIHASSDIDSDAVKDIVKEILNNTTVTLKI